MNKRAKLDSVDRQDIFKALSNFDLPAIRRYQKNTKAPNLAHIPGDRGAPVIGHTYRLLKDVEGMLDRQYARYGPVFRIRLLSGLGDLIFLIGPDANRMLLQNEDKIFSNFLAYDPSSTGLIDNHLLERDFADHKAQRRILQLAFKRPAIEGHMALMNPLIKAGVSVWPTDHPVKTMGHVKKLLLNVGASVFLGSKIGPETDKLNQAFLDLLAGAVDPLKKKEIWFSPYARGLRGNKTISSYVSGNIPSRRKLEGKDLLSQFCKLKNDEGKLFTDEEICNHIIFVLFAAHDTTTSALCSMLYALATNEEWQEELRKEMVGLNKSELEFDDIDSLEKTGLTFKEALRMYPPVPFFPRYALKEFEFNGHRIPADSTIFATSLVTHYMPEYWSNPTTFDPYRFSSERAEDKRDIFQYTPFGGGAHKCLGMHFAEIQGKMFLFHFLKHYRVSKNLKMTRYKYNSFPLTFPRDGLPLTFTKM